MKTLYMSDLDGTVMRVHIRGKVNAAVKVILVVAKIAEKHLRQLSLSMCV